MKKRIQFSPILCKHMSSDSCWNAVYSRKGLCAEGHWTECIRDRAMKFKGPLVYPYQFYITDISLIAVKLFLIYVT